MWRIADDTSCRRTVGVLFFCMSLALGAAASVPLDKIEAFFDEYDKSLAELASDPAIVNGSVGTVGQRLTSYMQQRDALHTLMRINSSGKVINEAVRSGKPGRRNRSVARQSWYAAVTDELEPYYGYVKPARGPLMLFWAKPLKVDDGGEARSGGALLAKIDLADAIRKAAGSLDEPFTVRWDDDQLLAHKGGAPDDARAVALTIKGIEELTFRAAPSVVAASPEEQASPEKPEAAPAAAEGESGDGDTGKTGAASNSTRMLFAVLAGVLVFLIALIWALVHVNHKNHERLMREIDGVDTSARAKTAGPAPGRPDTRQAHGPARSPSMSSRPTERQMPQVPVQPTHTPTPQPQAQVRPQTRQHSQQQMQPRPQTGQHPQQARPQTRQYSQQQPQQQPGRQYTQRAPQQQQAPRRPDTATIAGASVVSPEMYERLRQQLTQELSTQLRAQLQDELDAERRKLNARAQVFHRTVQTHIQELVDQMTEAEGRWNELSTAMKNSAFKLKQALDGLQHGGV